MSVIVIPQGADVCVRADKVPGFFPGKYLKLMREAVFLEEFAILMLLAQMSLSDGDIEIA